MRGDDIRSVREILSAFKMSEKSSPYITLVCIASDGPKTTLRKRPYHSGRQSFPFWVLQQAGQTILVQFRAYCSPLARTICAKDSMSLQCMKSRSGARETVKHLLFRSSAASLSRRHSDCHWKASVDDLCAKAFTQVSELIHD